MTPGSVTYQRHRSSRALERAFSEELGNPTCHQRRDPAVGADRRSLSQPQLAESSVSGECLREDDVGVVAGAGEHGHYGNLIGLELVQHRIEAWLTMMEC